MFFWTCIWFLVICYAGGSSKVRYSRHMDLAKGIGLICAFQACRRLIKGATLWLGCPCSQWVWISRGTTGRNRLRVSGSKRVPSVKAANRLVRRLCYLSLVCMKGKMKPGPSIKDCFKNSRVIQWQLIPYKFPTCFLNSCQGWNIPEKKVPIGAWSSRPVHCSHFTNRWRWVFWVSYHSKQFGSPKSQETSKFHCFSRHWFVDTRQKYITSRWVWRVVQRRS